MAVRVNQAEHLHTVLALSPVALGASKTSQAVSMKNASHVSWGVYFGASNGVPASIVVNQCTDANGDNATPLPSFRYYYQLLGGAGNDILNGNAGALSNTVGPGPNWAQTTAGITSFPASVANLVYIIEIDDTELEAIADAVGPQTEYPYLQVVVTNAGSPVNTTQISMVALLSPRYPEKGGFTATT
jgi:hypothetical protein